MDDVTGSIDQSPTLSWAQLGDIAQRLYGTDADLWTVTSWPEGCGPGDLRWHLRTRLNIVQDPITRIWFYPDTPTRPDHRTLAVGPSSGSREGEAAMTKAAFTEWLQMKLSESDCHEEYGDLWR